jgi:hypothetical protein
MTTLMRAIECVVDSNSKANREATPSCNPLLRFPEVWNATLHASELGSATGFRNGLYEGSDHTSEASTRRQSGALAGRCVLHPPHSTLLLFSAEPANSWNIGNPYPIALRQSCPSPVTWKIVYDTPQMRRYPVSTKLNNSQNEGAESATPVTLGTPIQARLYWLQLLLNTHAGTLRCRRVADESSNRLGLRTPQQIECDDVRDHQQARARR